jgi:DNA gyrase subunit A
MIAIQTSARNGLVVGAVSVLEDEEIMLISDGGTLVRTPVSGISVLGRNTQGVKLINISDDEKLVGVEPVAEYQGDDTTLDELDP